MDFYKLLICSMSCGRLSELSYNPRHNCKHRWVPKMSWSLEPASLLQSLGPIRVRVWNSYKRLRITEGGQDLQQTCRGQRLPSRLECIQRNNLKDNILMLGKNPWSWKQGLNEVRRWTMWFTNQRGNASTTVQLHHIFFQPM